MANPPNILILTAAFGEGHNSAARSLAIALQEAGAITATVDPCMIGSPACTRLLASGYRWITTHGPKVWEWIYRSADHCNLGGPPKKLLGGPLRAMLQSVQDFQPDAVVSTYPLYPYFMPEVIRSLGRKLPIFTVVTDSIEINATWLRAESDLWLVTDPATREILVTKGISAEKVVDSGFPVHPGFSRLGTVSADDPCRPFRVLYFPTSKLPLVRRHSRAILDASPDVQLTLVLGKNVRLLYGKAREIKQAYPGRVRILGWTRRVPELMSRHHLIIGKAGGATVHEAIAARCPMLIHHLVPGQEQGNLDLLERLGCGALAATPEWIRESVAGQLCDDATRWRAMKAALIRYDRHAGASSAASAILSHLRG